MIVDMLAVSGSLDKVTPEGEVTYLVERYFEDIDNIGIFSRRNNWLSVVPDEGQVLFRRVFRVRCCI